jgi:hypothetical protein
MSIYPTDLQAHEFQAGRRLVRVIVAACSVMMAAAGLAHADVLVTDEGERITTQGPWTVKGRQIVFTSVTGTLSAVRLSEIDLEASEVATREANAPPTPDPEPQVSRPKERRAPVLTITDSDIPRGTPVSGGPAEALVGRLRNAFRFDDLEGAMQQVLLEGTSPEVRQVIRDVFRQVMERKLRDIVFEPASDGAGAGDEVQDGVTYRPNAAVVGRLRVLLEPSIGDGDADVAEASFFVGDRLGTYMIVAPLVVPDAPSAGENDADEAPEAPGGTGAESPGPVSRQTAGDLGPSR